MANKTLGLGLFFACLLSATGCVDHVVATCYIDDETDARSAEIYYFEDGEKVQLLGDGFYPENIDLSKDATMIAYTKQDSEWEVETAEVYTMDISSRQETRITRNEFQDNNPNLSPQKDRVVYWSKRNGSIQLYLMDISDPRSMTESILIDDTRYYIFDPEWSHNGRMIAFNMGLRDSKPLRASIFVGVLDADRKAFIDVFQVSGNNDRFMEVDPAWSLDDQIIAFSTYEGEGEWNVEGVEPENLKFWKIKTVEWNLPGQNAETIWSDTSSTRVSWLPIYFQDNSTILAIMSSFPEPPTPYFFGTQSHLITINTLTGEETPLPGGENCYFPDYVSAPPLE